MNLAQVTPEKVAAWLALGIALVAAVSILWDKVFGLVKHIREDVTSLQKKSETTAQLAVNVAANQSANPASPNPDPTLVEAVKQTLDNPPNNSQPMQVRT